MSPVDGVTLGELTRTIEKMDARINEQLVAVNRRLDTLQFVNQETYRVQVTAIEKRLEDLEDAKRWTTRTFVAAFLFPALVGLLVAVMVSL